MGGTPVGSRSSKTPSGGDWLPFPRTVRSGQSGVRASGLLSLRPAGIGASRFCDLGGRNYLQEQVVHDEPPTAITMRITVTNLPFATADIRFRLDQVGGRGWSRGPRFTA